jgi:hypothetical protein
MTNLRTLALGMFVFQSFFIFWNAPISGSANSDVFIFCIASNSITFIPSEIGSLIGLEWIWLGKIKGCVGYNLQGNKLFMIYTDLHNANTSFVACYDVILENNHISSIPNEFFGLKNLKYLLLGKLNNPVIV